MSNAEEIVRLRISLDDTDPEIWRRVDVPLGLSLTGLHDVIQAIMAWQSYHLYEFRVGEKRYGVPDPEWDFDPPVVRAKNVKLRTILDRAEEQFHYTYDFGDDWSHTITVEKIFGAEPDQTYPQFIDGERRAPPEDVGGLPGYYEFINIIEKGKGRKYQEAIDWCGGSYDPNDIGLLNIRLRIGAIVKRRRAGKAAYERSKR